MGSPRSCTSYRIGRFVLLGSHKDLPLSMASRSSGGRNLPVRRYNLGGGRVRTFGRVRPQICTGSPLQKSNGCQTYTKCKGGVEVTLCTTKDGGNAAGDPNIGWDMLSRHPMP